MMEHLSCSNILQRQDVFAKIFANLREKNWKPGSKSSSKKYFSSNIVIFLAREKKIQNIFSNH
jgi:hypothetical protein